MVNWVRTPSHSNLSVALRVTLWLKQLAANQASLAPTGKNPPVYATHSPQVAYFVQAFKPADRFPDFHNYSDEKATRVGRFLVPFFRQSNKPDAVLEPDGAPPTASNALLAGMRPLPSGSSSRSFCTFCRPKLTPLLPAAS